MLAKVEICGVNTSKLAVLPGAEIVELLKRTKDGDKEAREKLISGNLRLVLSIIQRFVNRGESVDDLFQVGCIGLIKSIDNFDISQNVRFSTYAVPMNILCGNVHKGCQNSHLTPISRASPGMPKTAVTAMFITVTPSPSPDIFTATSPIIPSTAFSTMCPSHDVFFIA